MAAAERTLAVGAPTLVVVVALILAALAWGAAMAAFVAGPWRRLEASRA